jgi:hypothetical protein
VELRRRDEKLRPPARPWTSNEEAELERLLDADKEAAEIAVTLNRSRLAIYARLLRLYRKRSREAKLLEVGLRAKK